MPTRKIIIVGCGGFAREVVWALAECNVDSEVIGFLDDSDVLQGTSLDSIPVLGRVYDWPRFSNADFVVAVGSPRIRHGIVCRMRESGDPRFATVIHSSARLSRCVRVGAGSILTAGCVITTGIELGEHVILNLNSTIGHDALVGDFCTIAPMVAISGNVRLGPGTEVGTGACLREGITMGRGSMAGMGAVVVRDVAERDLVVGNPARVMRQLAEF